MVQFKEGSFGEREMIATLDSVHYDKPEEVCQFTGRTPKSTQLHFLLTPLQPKEWKQQHWWLYDSLSQGSSWYDIVMKFVKMNVIAHDDVESAKDCFSLAEMIVKNLKGKNIKFVERRIGRAMSANWYPQEIVA